MLRFVASYFTSNIKPNTTNEENSQENIFNFTPKNFDFFSTGTEHSDEVEQPDDISTLRERKLKELTEKVLLRKIYRQVVMNRYAQDHLPLSQIQEKLEEDDLPLKVLQDKLRQKENSSIYTTIRENINFLLYSNPSKPKKSRQSLFTPIITETDNTGDVSTPRDDRDYDIWDDAIIGHLMNLVDTIGVDITRDKNFWEDSGVNSGVNSKKSSGEGSKENSCENSVGIGKEITSKVDNELIKKIVTEVINEVIKEEEFKNKSSRLGSTKVTTKKEDKETIVARSSATNVAIKKNTIKKIENNTSTNIENNATTNVENVIAENHLESVKKDIMYDIQEEDESRKIAEEIINFGETINVAESLLRSDNLMNDNISLNSTKSVKRKPRRSLFSLGQQHTSSSNNKNPDQTHHSLKRNISNLSRKSSIHSKKSYDNISRRSSISSKFSFSTDIIIEEQNEDGSINNKFSKRNHSSRKLHFLKNIWKNNNELPLVNNEESFISSREIREKYYQQFDQIDMIKSDQQQNVCGTAGSDPDYSNFYLSMPNGKWMVRTRTGSRKITGTQYVDKEFI